MSCPATEANIPRGTQAHAPDLNWSQVRETILMLGLAVTQIRDALTHGDESVTTLSQMFTTLASEMEQIKSLAEQMPETDDSKDARQDLLGMTKNVSNHALTGIVAFQFYDRLVQRLDHVCHAIDELGALISEPNRLFNPGEWVEMQRRIVSKYTMQEERHMFELIMQGVSIEDALVQSRDAIKAATEAEDDNFELF